MTGALILEFAAFAVFAALSHLFHDREGQPILRRDLFDDVLYFLFSVLVSSKVIAFIYGHVGAPAFAAAVSHLPLLAQTLVLVVAYDLAQYGLHRWFHGGALWRFHAVHHSAEEIDILTSFRIHPFNFLLYIAFPTALFLLAGFRPAAFASLGAFNFLMSCLTHANLNWTYGPFRYVIASPMFHRWHHAVVEGSQSRNYSPNFPVWDLLFGTFHMPKGERPIAYGAPEVPRRFLGQMAYPFRAS